MQTIYLNGQFLPAELALLPVSDRGFRFGDGVFETIPFYAGKPYQWAFHMQRLAAGLEALRIHLAPPPDFEAIASRLAESQTGFIRIAVSRGSGSKGYRPLPNIAPTVIVEFLPRSETASEATLWLSSWRKPSATALPAHKLAAIGTNSTLALLEAGDHNCTEALLLNAEGHLCEAASGNLFWIAGGQLFTPCLSTGCLEGATRHALLRLAEAQEARAPLEALQTAEAVFITNCNWGIMPVLELRPHGWRWRGQHPLISELTQRYHHDIHASI